MGQKVHPTGFRLGIPGVSTHNSIWYAEGKKYVNQLLVDIELRRMLEKRFQDCFVSRIVIERLTQTARVIIYTSRPGMLVGKKGEGISKLRQEISKKMGIRVHVDVKEIRKPDLDAELVAQGIADQLRRRMMFRRVMKRAVQSVMKAGAQGVRVQLKGRLGGAEIARKEWYREGRVPLHTLRANIQYSSRGVLTTHGIIGIKVWIFKDEVLTQSQASSHEAQDKERFAAKTEAAR